MGRQLTIPQIAGYAAAAGFTGDALVQITAIALRESGGNTDPAGPNDMNNPRPGCRSWGLVQINTCPHYNNAGIPWRENPSSLLDPAVNMAAAFSMSKGGTDFGPWTTYRAGIVPPEVGKVRAALAKTPPEMPSGSSGAAGAAAGARAAAGTSPSSSTAGTVPVGFGPDLGMLTDPNTWRRLLYIMLGGAGIGLGLVIIKRDLAGDVASAAIAIKSGKLPAAAAAADTITDDPEE